MKKANAIFVTFDDVYFPYFKALLNSIKKNYPEHPIILVCYTGKDEKILNFLSYSKKIKLIPLLEITSKYSIYDQGVVKSLIIYQRYRLWSEEFSQYDNILHMDADTLVLKPLDKLFSLDTFFICRDYIMEQDIKIFWEKYEKDSSLRKLLAEDGLKYPSQHGYLANAGVFLIPKHYRSQKNFSEMINLTTRYQKYLRFADQSVISIWCLKHKISLSNESWYNYLPIYLIKNKIVHFDELIKNVFILHFVHIKPGMNGFGKYTKSYSKKIKKLFYYYLFLDNNSWLSVLKYFIVYKRRINIYRRWRFK